MFSWGGLRSEPIVVGHRGAASVAPENTIASFRQAFADGSDAVELDVQLTLDGEVVVFHDKRIDRTTDGSGLLKNITFRDLRNLSAGTWFARRFADERVPLLAEVLEIAEGRGVNIELKLFGGDAGRKELADRTYEIVREMHAEESVLVSSFHHRTIDYFKRRHPSLMVGLLVHPLRHAAGAPIGRARSIGAGYLIFNGTSVRQHVIRRSHDEGLLTMEYTVNSDRRLSRALRFNLDGIITDRPRWVRSMMS